MKRKCTNCAFCERFKYSQTDKTEMIRCWHETGVCDHAFVISMVRAEKYKCDNHRFQNEMDKELFEEATYEYESYKRAIKKLEEKYPKLLSGGSSENPKDLEEAARRYGFEEYMRRCNGGEYGTSEDTFIAGAKWQKEQMMKEAVEGCVTMYANKIYPTLIGIRERIGDTGDKVKIIIVKEDKQ